MGMCLQVYCCVREEESLCACTFVCQLAETVVRRRRGEEEKEEEKEQEKEEETEEEEEETEEEEAEEEKELKNLLVLDEG